MPNLDTSNQNNPDTISGGPFEARYATTAFELEQAQRLRYRVLFKDSNGTPGPERSAGEIDKDQWDEHADHIIVCDNRLEGTQVVGTLRIVSTRKMPIGQRFYTEQAFDLKKIRNRYNHVVELGRFCISPDTRNGIVLALMWKLASNYILKHEVDLMLGCASFPGTDAHQHSREFGFLQEHALTPADLAIPPVVPNHHKLQTLCASADGTDQQIGDLRDMPPLVRGYLKLGARCSDCAIVDPEFNTTFVCIYVDAANFANTTTLLAPKVVKKELANDPVA